MYRFAVKHPVIFELLLFPAGLIIALAFMLGGSILYLPSEFSGAIGRIAAGILIFLIFRRYFDIRRQFSGLLIALPAAAFALWNVVNCMLTGGTVSMPDIETFIYAIAPAVFEEVIYRFVFLENLREHGTNPRDAMLISGVLFGATHLTNAAGISIAQAALQAFYATVVGIVFGAIYIRKRDLFSLILIHMAIDACNRIFLSGETTPVIAYVLFALLLAAEAAYAAWLIKDAGSLAYNTTSERPKTGLSE